MVYNHTIQYIWHAIISLDGLPSIIVWFFSVVLVSLIRLRFIVLRFQRCRINVFSAILEMYISVLLYYCYIKASSIIVLRIYSDALT